MGVRTDPRPGWQVAELLLMASRVLTEEIHARLAEQGHPSTRPAHGFALQAIGSDGTTAGELARALGLTKQGAAKLADELERQGYVVRSQDPDDRRRKTIVRTDRALEFLALSAREFDTVTAAWRRTLGHQRFAQLCDDLELVVRASSNDGSLPALRPIW
jgi:DNA-binding MarR family transcriptional regulator